MLPRLDFPAFLLSALILCWCATSALAQASKPSTKPVDAAALKAADEALKDKGLRRQGTALVLVDEAQLSKALSADQRKLIREVKQAAAALGEALAMEQAAEHVLNQYYVERRQLNAELGTVKGVDRHNQMVRMINELSDRIRDMEKDTALEEHVAAARKGYGTAREQYIEHLLKARKLAEKLERAWADVQQDSEVRQLVEQLTKATGKPYEAAESKSLNTLMKRLTVLEGEVLSESVALRSDGGNTFVVDVTVNGKHTQEMYVDSGASIIALPYQLAQSMELEPGASAETVVLRLADGRPIPAKKISIASVRVGKFTVENVEAAVLPPQLAEAPPLLGMSFLGNFKFDIDSSAKKLTMTRIEGGEVPAPKKSPAGKSGTKSRKRNTAVPDIVE